MVHPGAFSGLSRLRKLYIQQNQLTTIDGGTFAGLSALVELWLYRNRLSELSADALAELPLLERLVVWSNRLTELPSGVFTGLERLEELYLSDNQLATVAPGVFSDLAGLNTLSMQQNELAELSDGMFGGLYELLSLNLDSNPGAPFTLDVGMARTDTADLAAPGPANVVLALAEGAPFRMRIPLSVTGGSLTTDVAVIEKGRTRSAEFTVTMNPGSQSGTEVVVGPAPPVPDSIVGVNLVAADTLVLFNTSGDVSGSVPGMAAAPPESKGTLGLAPVMLVVSARASPGAVGPSCCTPSALHTIVWGSVRSESGDDTTPYEATKRDGDHECNFAPSQCRPQTESVAIHEIRKIGPRHRGAACLGVLHHGSRSRPVQQRTGRHRYDSCPDPSHRPVGHPEPVPVLQ